ncbi:hypothetical protein BABINDRAFT_89965 [Babjeviella inositovora NRRL Y-12698]|uniref:Uncharacterized protein n=1 Tax=Babjeviella inositovora NRRL Y-12698 TaxID=984486 RepID=A0A1E3QKX3_9ASCO|nr:uncharacterized protein BABINDRAFT_89965 [Babjeviella inositovora NRRL Y-12698]ODQ78325.1 hypothetical protein BABINDRAFT_89965 [Babjeviella inositovora NRRL Y-12698]
MRKDTSPSMRILQKLPLINVKVYIIKKLPWSYIYVIRASSPSLPIQPFNMISPVGVGL